MPAPWNGDPSSAGGTKAAADCAHYITASDLAKRLGVDRERSDVGYSSEFGSPLPLSGTRGTGIPAPLGGTKAAVDCTHYITASDLAKRLGVTVKRSDVGYSSEFGSPLPLYGPRGTGIPAPLGGPKRQWTARTT